MKNKLKIFSGRSNPVLASKIAKSAGKKLGKISIKTFSDGEIWVKYEENIRGCDVFLIQSTNGPSENILELALMADAAVRASASSVSLIIPYFGYGRQDRKDQPRVPITGRLIADLITTAGSDRVMMMDLHAGQVQGFFSATVDELTALPILASYFVEKKLDDWVVVSPDIGGTKRARDFANKLGAPLAIIEKRRIGNKDTVEALNIIGEVKDRSAILFDDEINTGGTMIAGSKILKDNGVKDVYVAATHGVFPNSSLSKIIRTDDIKEIVVTDSLPIENENSKLKILPISELLGEAIKRTNRGDSVGALFL